MDSKNIHSYHLLAKSSTQEHWRFRLVLGFELILIGCKKVPAHVSVLLIMTAHCQSPLNHLTDSHRTPVRPNQHPSGSKNRTSDLITRSRFDPTYSFAGVNPLSYTALMVFQCENSLLVESKSDRMQGMNEHSRVRCYGVDKDCEHRLTVCRGGKCDEPEKCELERDTSRLGELAARRATGLGGVGG